MRLQEALPIATLGTVRDVWAMLFSFLLGRRGYPSRLRVYTASWAVICHQIESEVKVA